MTRQWIAGWNRPATLPASVLTADTWNEAKSIIRAEIGEHFLDRVDDHHEQIVAPDAVMGDYVTASAIIRGADPEHSFSLFYDGWVWWVADVPAEFSTEVPTRKRDQ